MKAITLHQPWATLISLGVKSIETRSWSTSYRGPLAIHAAARPPIAFGHIGEWQVLPNGAGGWTVRHVPTARVSDPAANVFGTMYPERFGAGQRCHALLLGAVVATCTLVDVVPILQAGTSEYEDAGFVSYVLDGHKSGLQVCDWGGTAGTYGKDQEEDRRGVRYVHIEDQRPYGDFSPGRYAWLLAHARSTMERCPACAGTTIAMVGSKPTDCPACEGEGRREPVPAKGRQGLWEWEPVAA